MIELRALGTADLKGSAGDPLKAVLAQPKRFALLTYLAVHHHQDSHRRDSVIALFWPELDAEHARGALRQALRFLRRALGEGVVNGHSEEELRIEKGSVWCDAAAFEQACAEARWPQALELYRGDFFDGFFVSGASAEFDGWVTDQRTRLRHLAVLAARRLAERLEAEGDDAAALHWTRRAFELSSDDEGMLQHLIALLDRLGDRAGAVRAYEEFERRLATDHEVAPSPETQRLIRTVRTRAAERAPRPKAMAMNREAPRVPATTGTRQQSRVRTAVMTAAAIVAVALTIVVRTRSGAGMHPEVVAVLPFRVTGASDELRYLREGMIDLLAAKLTGDVGPRAMHPRTLMRAWRRAVRADGQDLPDAGALGLARRLGVGQLLQGSVVGTPDRLVLDASLLDVARGTVRAQATVTGPSDSLSVLVDQLTMQLLARGAGEAERRVAALTTTSLPALRAYLSGQAAYRRGEYSASAQLFREALGLDTTFALANLGLVSADAWVSGHSSLTVAYTNRARLNWRDRALLTALLGPRYPRPSPLATTRAAWERAVAAVPDMPEAWYWLGELYFHEGAALRLEAPHRWAARAMERAIALDSTFAAPLVHRIDVAAMEGDTATVRRLGARFDQLDSSGDLAPYVRWRVATSLGDSAMLLRVRTGLRQMPVASLWEIENIGQLDAIGLEDVERVAAVLRQRGAGSERWLSLTYVYSLALNRGRPESALAVLAALDVAAPAGHSTLRAHVLEGVFGDGDSMAAAHSVEELERGVPAILARDPDTRDRQLDELCVTQLWRTSKGDFSKTDRSMDRLRLGAQDRDGSYGVAYQRLCAAMLRAIQATLLPRGDGSDAGDALDSMLQVVPASAPSLVVAAALTLAHLRESRGDYVGARAAIRSRGYGRVGGGGPSFSASCFREEGRLAALTGDRLGAIRSYRMYLALRARPEPALQPAVDQVRSELARLERDSVHEIACARCGRTH